MYLGSSNAAAQSANAVNWSQLQKSMKQQPQQGQQPKKKQRR
jgi:hypothetical protein